MALMQVEEVVGVYRELAKHPVPVSARFNNSAASGLVAVSSEWTQRDIERGEKSKFSRSHVIGHATEGGYENQITTSPHETATEVWNKQSPTGSFTAILRRVTGKKGEDKQFVEIWSGTHKMYNIDVQAADKHGKIYEPDGQFGSFEWSSSEGHLLYIAERKLTKTTSYFDTKGNAKTEDDAKKTTEDVAKGDEFLYKEDWGEMLVGKHRPVICVLDVDTGDISVLDNVPEHISPGQAIWAPDESGVVFIGWPHDPYRLGLIYCAIRKSAVYYIDLEASTCSPISADNQSVRALSFSPDQSKLVYLENREGGPHYQCSRLMMYDWNSKETSTVVDIVNSAKGSEFPGIYTLGLAERCWAADNVRFLITTFWRSKQVVIAVNTNTKTVSKLNFGDDIGFAAVCDLHKDRLILNCSAPDQPNYLAITTLPDEGNYDNVTLHKLDEEVEKVQGISWEVIQFQPTEDRVHEKYPNLDYEGLLLMPPIQDDGKPPLAVLVHGGPHSLLPADFFLYSAGLCKCGFAVLAVNYRGSLGFGQDSIQSLLGNIGDQDIKDVQCAVEGFAQSGRVNADKAVVIGGSHGGFITGHLIGQYPDYYKAAVCRNAVLHLPGMLSTTDIPDWIYVEIGDEFQHDKLPTSKSLEIMWNKSPMKYIDQVKTPLMAMLGLSDLRVPPSQGKEYIKQLRARNIPCRLLAYPDNSHPISKVDAEADAFVNIVLWFMKHI